jgi:hypothetical protein
MGQNPEPALPLTGGIGPATQGTPEPPLVPAEGRLGLPPLAVHPPVPAPLRLLPEPLDHLPPVLGPGPLAALPPAVQRDHRGAHAEAFPAVAVVGLAVEGGIGQDPVPGHDQGRLGHHRSQLRGVVGRAGGDGGPGEEVAGGVAGDRQLDPAVGALRTAGAPKEVAGGVPALQAGGVDGGGRLVADQAALLGADGGLQEEADELPFFSSRPAA